MKKIVLMVLLALLTLGAQAQKDSTKTKKNLLLPSEFKVDAELRPRMELRGGYRLLCDDTSRIAFFINQRTRLSLSYTTPKFALVMSVQDCRTWGETDPRANKGTTQLFEGYAEWFVTPKFSIKAGRQRLMYDNERLFAQNDWRVTAASHDGLKLAYNTEKIGTELSAFFNQNTENVFGTNFQPTGFSNYKFLGVYYFKAQPHKNVLLMTLNACDGFQDATNHEKMHFRFTSGGRIKYSYKTISATVAAYYQYGWNTAHKPISAFYVQPEIMVSAPKRMWFRLGAELMSGQNASKTGDAFYRSFVALYGVVHRFNGYMDQFTAFPGDLNNAGLINPYLFINVDIVPNKLSLRSDWHGFWSANNFVHNGAVIPKYLGVENDWLLTWNINSFTKLEWGFSWLLPTPSMTIIRQSGTAKLFNYWSYLSVVFKPTLFKYEKNG